MAWQIPNAFGLADQFLAVLPCKFYATINWWTVFAALGHTAIAFNRFSQFCCQDYHADLWTARRIKLLLVICLVVTLVAAVPSYVSTLVCPTADGRLFGASLVDTTLRTVCAAHNAPYECVTEPTHSSWLRGVVELNINAWNGELFVFCWLQGKQP